MNSSEIFKAQFKMKKETLKKTEDDTSEEKNNLNSTIKSNLKFNSELLNKPFGTLKVSNDENKFNNFDNVENFNKSSTSVFFRNEYNENNISNISFSGSMNFNKSNYFNSSLFDSKGKRKPFEKLTFNLCATEQNNILDYSNEFGLTSKKNLLKVNNNFHEKITNDANNKNEDCLKQDNVICNKNKKENIKVENFGKIQNRIKDTLNANRSQKMVEYSGTEENDNSASFKIKANISNVRNNMDFNDNSNLININKIMNNKGKNNKSQRLNTAGTLIPDTNNHKISLESSRQEKKDESNMKENSKEYISNKNKNLNNELNNLNKKQDIDNNYSINSSRGGKSNKEDKPSKNKKETSSLLDSHFSNKSMEETHLTKMDNLVIKSKNPNENVNQTSLININTSNSQIQFQNQSDLNKIHSNSNMINSECKQNQLINSCNNIKKYFNETSELNENNANNVSCLNKTNISQKEQSVIIKSKNKRLSKEELEKAKLFNNQFDNKVPFWIKFFLDFEENPESIQSTSSYFKANNKMKYIEDLIDMVKKDAKLYEATEKEQIKKKEGKQIIKSLLLTEVKVTKKNPFNSEKSEINSFGRSICDASNIIEDDTKSISESIDKTLAKAAMTEEERENNDKINKPINKLLEGVLEKYEKIERDEARKKGENFSDFKNRLIKKEDVKDKYGLKSTDKYYGVVQSAINRYAYPNLVNIKENLYDDERIFKTIDNLKFPEIFDPFLELDYSQFQLGYLDKKDLHRLFEIDKKLHEINPDNYSESINSDLYIMQMEFNDGKKERLKEIEKEYKEKMARIKNKEIKKPSVFDVKQEDNNKPKYIDYLQEMKSKKDLNDDLFEIDNKIRIIRNQEVSEERRNKIFEDLNIYYAKNPEYYEMEMAKRIPEDFNFNLAESSMKEINSNLNKLKADLEEFENRVTDKDPNKTYEKFEIEKKNEIKQEMIKNYETAIEMLENIRVDNQEKIRIVEKLENKIIEDEIIQKELGR